MYPIASASLGLISRWGCSNDEIFTGIPLWRDSNVVAMAKEPAAINRSLTPPLQPDEKSRDSENDDKRDEIPEASVLCMRRHSHAVALGEKVG
jgi:hypothetical protein